MRKKYPYPPFKPDTDTKKQIAEIAIQMNRTPAEVVAIALNILKVCVKDYAEGRITEEQDMARKRLFATEKSIRKSADGRIGSSLETILDKIERKTSNGKRNRSFPGRFPR